MSWQLTAGTIVHIMQKYDQLEDDSKYLLREYIQEFERKSFEYTQRQGACKALMNALKMLNDVVPGKTANFCWHCGKIEFESDERTLVDMGWIQSMKVMYSGHLCPTCQDEGWTEFFLNGERDIDSVAKRIADYGLTALNEWKQSKSWSDAKTDAAVAKITTWVKQIFNSGPYGPSVKKLTP